MIKFIQCVRSRRELSLQEFRRYWQDYEARVRRVAEVSGAIGAMLDTTLAVDANLQVVAARGTAAPFEGVAEILWERAPDLSRMANDSELRAAITAMQELQAEFVDLERSSFFFAASQELLPGVVASS